MFVAIVSFLIIILIAAIINYVARKSRSDIDVTKTTIYTPNTPIPVTGIPSDTVIVPTTVFVKSKTSDDVIQTTMYLPSTPIPVTGVPVDTAMSQTTLFVPTTPINTPVTKNVELVATTMFVKKEGETTVTPTVVFVPTTVPPTTVRS